MTKPVLVRFRKDHPSWPKGAEFVVSPGADAAVKIYGDAIDILSYEDGTPYEQSLKEQADARREDKDEKAEK